ncbi:MFS transporter [Caproiciproducens sp. R1]|jgi:Major Facilitator Superfamily.|uniref:MFS transporter n=1 Tax=Caproiciproducens sp. R1 TaxID=3435000 RepID=UPI00056FDE09
MKEKQYDLIVQVAALSIGVLLYTTSIIQASLGAIAVAFPNVPIDNIKLLQTITPIIMMISCFACGVITRFVRAKVVLVFSIILILVGGLLPAFIGGTFEFLLIMKGVFSVGYGLAFPFASSILVDLFPEGPVRNRMVGFKTAVGGLSSVVFAAVGGYLANINYRYAYAAFIIVIPVLLLIIFKLPDTEKAQPKETAASGQKDKLTYKTVVLALWNITFNVTLSSFFASAALVVVKTGAGDSSQAGLTISAYSAVSFLVGLFFPGIRKVLKQYALTAAITCVALCFFILTNATTFPMYIVGSMLFGFGFGLYNPELLLLIAQTIQRPKEPVATKSVATLAFSVVVICQSIGQSFSTNVLKVFTNLFGFEGLKAGWQVCWIYLLVAAVIVAVVTTMISRKKADTRAALEC